MAEPLKEENQKTVVSFVVGLLIGGLLVWAFSSGGDEKPAADEKSDAAVATSTSKTDTTTEDKNTTDTPVVPASLPVGEGKVSVGEQAGGKTVSIDSATFPTKEGWVGVRDYADGKLGMLLGVARFSNEQNLIPKEISLLTPTVAGRQYAIVFYSESGDRKFNLANDVQIDKEFATFTAK